MSPKTKTEEKKGPGGSAKEVVFCNAYNKSFLKGSLDKEGLLPGHKDDSGVSCLTGTHH